LVFRIFFGEPGPAFAENALRSPVAQAKASAYIPVTSVITDDIRLRS
jgi:hypothetical protein